MFDLSRSMGDPLGAYARIKVMLKVANQVNWQEQRQAVLDDGWIVERHLNDIDLNPSNDPTLPYCAAFQTPQATFIFVAGTRNTPMGNAIWNGYLGPYPIPGRGPDIFNPWGPDIAFRLWNAGLSTLLFRSPTIFVGHSAGGLVTPELVKKVYSNIVDYPALKVCNFGSPKPGGPNYIRSIPANEWVQWMNSDDAVPLVPPNPLNFPRITAGISVWQGQRLNAFVQGPSGMNILQDGTIAPGLTPAENPLPDILAIGAWLQAVNQNLASPHSVSTYNARLAAVNALAPQRVRAYPLPSPPSTSPPPSPPPLAAIRRAQVETGVTIFNDAQRQVSRPVDIPPIRAFTVVKIGRVWWTAFNGVRIAAGPRKSQARMLARFGNQFIRRLQNLAVVSTDDVIEQFTAYLSLAADPAGEFVPVMNTRIGG